MSDEDLKNLRECLHEWIEDEFEELKQGREIAGVNAPATCMAMGAIESYRRVLSWIEFIVGREK